MLFAAAILTALGAVGCENQQSSTQQEVIAVTTPAPIDAALPPVRLDAPVDGRPSTIDSWRRDGGPVPFEATAIVDRNPGLADRTDNADNTKINERDRGDTVTPGDQGNRRDEPKITATLRREIMRSDRLSFTAKNAKIITVGTKVTLRGPVQRQQEKVVKEQLTKNTAGVSRVDSQLEIEK